MAKNSNRVYQVIVDGESKWTGSERPAAEAEYKNIAAARGFTNTLELTATQTLMRSEYGVVVTKRSAAPRKAKSKKNAAAA